MTSVNVYASDPWGETPKERIFNSIDALSDATCVDAVNDRTKITRETYMELTMGFMKKMRLSYENSKKMSEMVIKDAFRKCPENF
jgi:hypothetical protein